MGLMETIRDRFKKNSELEWMYDVELLHDMSQRTYLKRLAKDTVLNFVGRTMSTAQFRFKKEGETVDSDWDYILNMRPNQNKSASDFWHKFFYKLIDDNEILLIFDDDYNLLIADDFVKTKYAIYQYVFESVEVDDYVFERKFTMENVIYLEYNNDELESFTSGLFNDYGELFGRMIEISMRNNQIRASVSVESTGTANNEKDKNGQTLAERLQKFIDKIYASFKNSSVAIVPKMKGFDYEEYTNKMGVSNQSLDELDNMKKSLIEDIARAVGVPPALVRGELADLDSNMRAYRSLCINPLVKKLQDELNAKLLTTSEIKNGKKIEIFGVQTPDIFELANSIDKLVSSAAFSPNDILEELGRERVDDPLMDKHYITKNYSSNDDELEGGEADDSETKD